MRPLIVFIILVILGGLSAYLYKNEKLLNTETNKTTPPPITTNNFEITATFKIVTNGTTRIFTDSKYHNQSTDVYINSSDPSLINVKKVGVTWSDFFKTLPMSLDKNCLVTGTKQTFCTNETSILTFKINNIVDPNSLDKNINQGDYLLVEYKAK